MEKVKKIFTGRKAKYIGNYRKSSVMILLLQEDGEVYVIFEKRALTLNRQPGDISLPGGLIEENETPEEAAIRETQEELKIDRKYIELIGPMDYFISPYKTIMYPFVAEVHTGDFNPNKDEVDHVFKVPLKYFLENEPKCYEVEITSNPKEDFPFELIEGGRNYKFGRGKMNQYFYQYGDYVIWGFTALIIKKFVETIVE